MSIPPAALLVLAVALCGAAIALAAFVWAVRSGQLDLTNAGAAIIFQEGERPAEAGAGGGRPDTKTL